MRLISIMSTPMPMIIPGFELRQRDGVAVIVSTSLEHAGFKNGFSTRIGGVSPLPFDALSLGNLSQDERDNVVENRRRFLTALDATDWTLVTARQVHSSIVRDVHDASDALSEPVTCDALVGRLPRTLFAVQTADCLPILLADRRTGTVAAVHAGWRGTLAGILARTVERMQQTYGSAADDFVAAIGPAIGPCCFEVGREVVDLFSEKFPYSAECFSYPNAGGRAHLDLNQINRRQLLDCGVRPEAIFDVALCTVCRNDLFFSYRKERGGESPVGRLMGAIGRPN